jgi:ABC-2 type transport system permease protein
MKNILLIALREFRSFFRSPIGPIVAAAVLLLDGVLFEGIAMGGTGTPRLSAQVLREFFFWTGGVGAAAAVILSMRLVAFEREKGTLVLINTAPVKDGEIILGKFLALFAFMLGLTILTVYMPALIFVNGRVSIAHILVGYLGMLLYITTGIAVGLFGSTLAKSQVISVLVGGIIMIVLVVMWYIARVADPPVNTFLLSLAVHHQRQAGFMDGVLRLENVVYYLAMIYFFLLAAVKTLEARRWR